MSRPITRRPGLAYTISALLVVFALVFATVIAFSTPEQAATVSIPGATTTISVPVPGPAGPPGPQGPVGPQGLTGPVVEADRTTTNGEDGSDGSSGANGRDGTDGTAGPRGPPGPAGPAGDDGADGATGARGPAGQPGPAAEPAGCPAGFSPQTFSVAAKGGRVTVHACVRG